MYKYCKIYKIDMNYTVKEMPTGKRKSISVSEEIHQELSKIGNYGESMDNIIAKCIQAYKKANKL